MSDIDQTGGAFLDHEAVPLRTSAAGQPGVASPQRGMTRKRHFPVDGEDPDPIVGVRRGRRQKKRRFRQVEPAGDALHLVRRQILGVEHDRQRIA